MSEILLVCLMVLVVIGNTSGRSTKKSEEEPKDLKNKKENMKEVFAHWQENKQNKRFTTTTSTSTMPPTTPTTPTTKIPETTIGKDISKLMKAMEDKMMKERKEEFMELKDEIKQTKVELGRYLINLCFLLEFSIAKIQKIKDFQFCPEILTADPPGIKGQI